MSTTRRRFLGWLGLAVAVGAVATVWRRDALRRWLLAVDPTPAPPGPLRDSTADTLRAAVLALLDERIEPDHYVDFFRWRAGRVSGARALYERFEVTVDRLARARGAGGFRGAERAEQRLILGDMLPVRGMKRVRRLLLDRDDERFARHIVREIFHRFARTDAWVIAGYDSWPGLPRAIARMGVGRSRA